MIARTTGPYLNLSRCLRERVLFHRLVDVVDQLMDFVRRLREVKDVALDNVDVLEELVQEPLLGELRATKCVGGEWAQRARNTISCEGIG